MKSEIRAVEEKVRTGVQGVLAAMRALESGGALLGDDVGLDGAGDEMAEGEAGMGLREAGQYVPRRVGGLDRLLMKLHFGTWVDSGPRGLVDDDDDS